MADFIKVPKEKDEGLKIINLDTVRRIEIFIGHEVYIYHLDGTSSCITFDSGEEAEDWVLKIYDDY
jgi:hypothetical protein